MSLSFSKASATPASGFRCRSLSRASWALASVKSARAKAARLATASSAKRTTGSGMSPRLSVATSIKTSSAWPPFRMLSPSTARSLGSATVESFEVRKNPNQCRNGTFAPGKQGEESLITTSKITELLDQRFSSFFSGVGCHHRHSLCQVGHHRLQKSILVPALHRHSLSVNWTSNGHRPYVPRTDRSAQALSRFPGDGCTLRLARRGRPTRT